MVDRINPNNLELLPRLVTNTRVSAPAGATPLRTAMLRHNTETTYVVPGDYPPMDDLRWFPGRKAPAQGSQVVYLIDGPATFETMVEAIETATSSSHFIVLLGWSLDVYTPMTAPGATPVKTFLNIVEERAKLGVAVRVLLWDNTEMLSGVDENNKALPVGSTPRRLNENAKAALEKLRIDQKLDVYANLDDNTKGWVSGLVAGLAGKSGVHSYGAHHHKILLVYGSDGLIGFCGGIDIDPNRIHMLHDVHTRVLGDAAEALWKIAEQRWSSAEDNGNPPSPASISSLAPATFAQPSSAPYLARVFQTVGNPDLTSSVNNDLWPSLEEALGRATRFIYMEDQYFWSLDLVDALVKAAKTVRYIVIVLPQALTGEQAYKRHAALGELVKRGGKGIEEKIGVFQATKPGHEYVHAKLFVMDDEYAMVTTANANNRGYFLDSEAAVAVVERAAQSTEGSRRGEWYAIEGNFARKMRIELWVEHLQLVSEEVFDGLAARVHWDALPLDARVAPYDALNLKKLQLIWSASEALDAWKRKNAEATAKGQPLPESTKPAPAPAWNDAEDRKPWWEAPYDDWAPEPPTGDSVIDPKD
ncbi:MAG: phospholipase D-like domain-containing protein [Byssovorax sp.]